MEHQRARQAAIDAVTSWSTEGRRAPKPSAPIRQLFGSNVFSDEVMRSRLPENIYKAIREHDQARCPARPVVADAVAAAMKDWAIEKGATHFTHLFQPMTGLTAEKHDCFLAPTEAGGAIAEFSGKELVRGEPDASSFPSGGIRATFEARGYTAWDPTSPAFILENPNGTTLVSRPPSLAGPARRSTRRPRCSARWKPLSKQALRILKLFGTDGQKVFTTVGPEQEYFLIDKNFYFARPDLINAGRTLFGAKPPKGQEMEDQYFGAIPERVLACMLETETELFKLGVPVKTRHNEVAPAQYEIAPIFENANVATDHNMLVMETLKRVADRYGLAPAAREAVRRHQRLGQAHQLVDVRRPGQEPAQAGRHAARQRPVPGLLVAVIRAVAKYADLLRVAVAPRRQRPPPGRQRGPAGHHLDLPGRQLQDIVEQLEKGGAKTTKPGGDDEDRRLGAADAAPRRRRPQPHQPVRLHRQQVRVPRRRARAQSIAGPIVVLNTIVAETLDDIATTGEGRRRQEGPQRRDPGAAARQSSRRARRSSSTATTTPRTGTRRPRSAACRTAGTRSTASPT